ncbi:MAG: dihydrofolate reductase [Patescibacteria group bacterium]
MRGLIVAHDSRGGIGMNGGLLWGDREQQEDMRNFMRVTKGQSVIMGSGTYDSLPDGFRPLPDRQNIMMSRGREAMKGVLRANSLGDAFSQADHDAWVIGGAQIYELARPTVNRAIVTEIDASIRGADTFIKKFSDDDEWEAHGDPIRFEADNRNRFGGSIVTYIRRNLIEE